MIVRPAIPGDRDWIASTLCRRWGSTMIVTKGRLLDAAALEALVALEAVGGDPTNRVGLLTYRIDADGLEVVTVDALRLREGIGTALLNRATELARDAAGGRLWLMTTNDNLVARDFYEGRGFRLVAVHKGAVDRARELKASIPLVGEGGVEIHDELEFELALPPPVMR
jgi:GNAT superfamily N-acetyltransferase